MTYTDEQKAWQTIIDAAVRAKVEPGAIDWELVDQAMVIVLRDAGVSLADFGGALTERSAQAWFPEYQSLKADTHFPVVYFVSTDEGRLVKIGTTRHLKARFAVLVSTMPTELILEATMPGSYREEKALHLHYAAQRVRGEWFTRTPGLDALIRQLRDQA